MIYRTILDKLNAWKKSPDRKPLLLKGARQIGKTWAMERFGSDNFEFTAKFDFDETRELCGVFERTRDVERLLKELALYTDVPLAGRQGIVIEKRFRHVTFANPGTFRIPLDVAIAGGTSDARNDVLFTLFALVEIGEKLGTGLVQLFALWEQNGWPRPEFKEQFDPERTFLTLDYNVPEENTPQKTEGTEQDNYDVNSGSVIEKQPPVIEKQPPVIEKQPPVIEREALYKMILNCLRNKNSLSAKEMALNLGFSERTVMRRLAELQSSGRLRRVGPDKGGHWEVLENN